jgi:nucleotide-binding universal stress UspA family protein
VKYIKQLKGAGAQEVIILHVIDEKELLVLSRVSGQYLQITAQIEKEVAEEMATIEADMTAEGYRVKLKVTTGRPFTEIMTTAAEEKASLIIMGSHGRSNIEEMFIGSVSENVIRHAKVPLLVISREI